MRHLQNSSLLLILALWIHQAEAGCTKDENDVYHCTGISWTARLWIIIGAAVLFIICNIILVHFVRRHYRKKRARLPAAPGARPYERGEFWERRRDDLPGYVPPAPLLPVALATAAPQLQMSQTSSRPWTTTLPPLGRRSTRTSELPPSYEKSYAQPIVEAVPGVGRRSSQSTLAEPSSPPAVHHPSMSIARSGPPLPSYSPSGIRT
ncbi:hypothetical protein P389DRAFT_94194 [Cystobasidium minutum MCA 4210]|uniref:uncharacterized protein n=1 Tax=Cystobasidium minutum MCA 4210 TaxID=1397322 RepID=UPI0034CDC421|eukprot:jgi/Rhomi1/94194/CE94193_6443